MKNKNNSGIGLLGILQIVFLVLKLTHNIDWSWPWVLSPTLVPIGLAISIGTIYGLALLILIGLGVYTYDEVLKKTKRDEQK